MAILANLTAGKVIPRNFGNIKHLTGFRLKDSGDTLVDRILQPYFTENLQFPKRDKLYVTEKIDGANAGVYKKGGILYPVMRKGYDVRTSEHGFLRQFAAFVADNAARFDGLLSDGERVCGEWMIKTHSLFYKLPHEPFVVFDMIQDLEKPMRPGYAEIITRCKDYGFITAGLLHEGSSISIEDALDALGGGFHGCADPPEGIVYRYERDGTFEMSAKYVSNLNVGGDLMNDESAYNEWVDGGWRL